MVAGTVDPDELYAGSYQRLVVRLYAVGGDNADAEDAVQEGCFAVIRKRRQLVQVSNPEAWVRTVTLNPLRDG